MDAADADAEAVDGAEDEPKVIPAVDVVGGEAMAPEGPPKLKDVDAYADADADADEEGQIMPGPEQPEAEPTPR